VRYLQVVLCRIVPAFLLLILSTFALASANNRDLDSELSPKLYTYLIKNYYSLLRSHSNPDYIDAIKPIFDELKCHLDQNNISNFDKLLLEAHSSAEFTNNVFEIFKCS